MEVIWNIFKTLEFILFRPKEFFKMLEENGSFLWQFILSLNENSDIIKK
jgi:hypothetical protein